MSQKSSGYERIAGDRYYTPAWVTQALVRALGPIQGRVLDPGAGAGHIMDALEWFGYEVDGFDIQLDPTGRQDIIQQDFLTATGSCDNIISNPPYGKQGKLAVAFIKKALEMTRENKGVVAMLLRVDFDSAHGRREIFGEHPAFFAKYALTKRIRWENVEQASSGPSENHAWFVWRWDNEDFNRFYGYLP